MVEVEEDTDMRMADTEGEGVVVAMAMVMDMVEEEDITEEEVVRVVIRTLDAMEDIILVVYTDMDPIHPKVDSLNCKYNIISNTIRIFQTLLLLRLYSFFFSSCQFLCALI